MPGRAESVAVIGLRAHSGWAALVAVVGSLDAPTILDRRAITLADAIPAQPYHQAAKRGNTALAHHIVEAAQEEARSRAEVGLANAVADAKNAGYELRRAALLVNRSRPLPPLDAILRSHPLLHMAEGELFRAALQRACEHCGLTVTRRQERDVYEFSSGSLKMTPTALRKHVMVVGRSCGSPWTADYKIAFVAAWSLLAE